MKRLTPHLPRILQPTLYKTILLPIPHLFSPTKTTPPKQRNPATIFILLLLLIGSNAINTLALKHSHMEFMRRADSKIDLLREVVDKVKRGEMSAEDVEKALGTGDEKSEREWEDVLREIEEEDARWNAAKGNNHKKMKDVGKEDLHGVGKLNTSIEKSSEMRRQSPPLSAPSIAQGNKVAAKDYSF